MAKNPFAKMQKQDDKLDKKLGAKGMDKDKPTKTKGSGKPNPFAKGKK